MDVLFWLETLLGIMLRPLDLPKSSFVGFLFKMSFLPTTECLAFFDRMFDDEEELSSHNDG